MSDTAILRKVPYLKTINRLEDLGKITRDDLEKAINKNIFSYADMVYQKHLEGDSNCAGRPYYLDHCREDFFAHALEQGHFNCFQERKMKFDDFHTVKSYVIQYKTENLAHNFVSQIASYSPQKTKRSIASQMHMTKSV